MGKVVRASLLALALFFAMGAGLPGEAEAASAYHIEVNKAVNTLTLYRDGTVQKTYPVATGRTPALTPEGTFEIIVKFNKPGWKRVPGGNPKNPSASAGSACG